ncbi:probable calcium-binding protein CML26 [Trifolium pratense]|uniref:probable calcium-binding protein CML26 n=1 Tax=Trifolium pratense TaxID=57577 RepID=UPI001E69167D|nr:probable calcium-binding protein CML26 [Trifolium pratense]
MSRFLDFLFVEIATGHVIRSAAAKENNSIVVSMAFIERNISSDGKRVMTLQQFKQWLKTSFDTNGDGRISKDKLREVLRITGGLFASWKSNKVLKSVDSNHDGFIDDKEFVNLAHFVEKHLNIRITK